LKDERGQPPIIVIFRMIFIAIGLILLLQSLSAFGETTDTDQISNLAKNLMTMIVGLILIMLGTRG